MIAKRIALFNHKGGVSKTTTTFNLGWMLASKGHRVIIVDTDPQSNLTGLVLGYKGPSELEEFYTNEGHRNLKVGLAPAFESKPVPLEAVDCIPVPGQDKLFLLPSHIGLYEYEVTLGIAQELSGSIQTLQNLPGSISALLEKTATKFEADYILIDMNPSLSSFNQNLLMTSDYFVVPTNPDFYSVMAIDSLCNVLPHWHDWAQRAAFLDILRNAVYPFPDATPRFMGTIIQDYRPHHGAPASSFQRWIDDINQKVTEKLVPMLDNKKMTFPKERYLATGANHCCLATIPDFNSLIAKSQETQTPVFALTESNIGGTGVVLEQMIRQRDNLRNIFSELANKVMNLSEG